MIEGMDIVLRPPMQTRADYIARHAALIAKIR